jgi:hypothetical protein
MNAKQLFAVLAVAMAGNIAMAAEATQEDFAVSTLSRAEAQALQASQDSTLMSGGEATVFVDRPVAATTVSRDEVREAARAELRAHRFDDLYAG